MQALIGDLDAQQRRAVADIESLTETISDSLAGEIQDVAAPIQHNVLLLAGRAGYVVIAGGQALEGEESLEFSLRGTALSRAEIRDFTVAGQEAVPEEVSRDDDEMILRVSLEDGPAAQVVAGGRLENAQVEIPIRFSLEDCRFFGLVCSRKRRFGFVGLVLPRVVGTAKGVFVGDTEVRSRSQKSLGPFSGGRVRSRIRTVLGVPTGLRRGRRTDTFSVRPDDGWRVVVDSVGVEVRAFRECDGHSATFTQISEHSLTVRVLSRTEAEPWVNCKVDTWIRFDQVKVEVGAGTAETETVELEAGSRSLLRLDDSVPLDNARLAHVEIESPLLSGGRALVRRGERRSGVTVDYDAVGGRTAYVEVNWRREN